MIVDGGELVITFQLLPFNGQFSIKKMKVAVVKYNAGNIRSVDYALRRLGVEAEITADEKVLRAADKVIFPGVGEAETTMNFPECRRNGQTDKKNCVSRCWVSVWVCS